MNTFFTHLKNDASHIRLTNAEKQSLRARLAAEISPQPPIPVVSPYQRFFTPRLLAVYSCIGILITSSGTAYAAQGALPNSPLYPIKIHINEPIAVALARSPEAKAEVNTRIAGERIREIKTLTEKGVLNADALAKAEENFDYHTAQVVTFVKDSQHKNTGTFAEKAATALNTLGTSLAETSEHGGDEEIKRNSKKFADHVRAGSQNILTSEKNKDSGARETDR